MLKAGITFKEGLSLIVESLKKNADKELIRSILNEVVNGKPFSEALLASKSFSEYEYYSIQIGEETGTTAQVCFELGHFFERKNEQKRIIILCADLSFYCIRYCCFSSYFYAELRRSNV